jgi:hypothetical protein
MTLVTAPIAAYTWPAVTITPEPLYECAIVGNLSSFPSNVFSSVYGGFCSAQAKQDFNKALQWIVDSNGNQANPLGARDAGATAAAVNGASVDLGQ